MPKQPDCTPPPYLSWLAVGTAIFTCLSMLAAMDHRFGYDVDVIDMPVLELVGLLVVAGGVYLFVPGVVRRSLKCGGKHQIYILAWIVIAGVAMRLVFMGTQPILEDDYNRYLLDGAVAANGISPYLYTPLSMLDGNTGNATLERLAGEAGPVLERLNYPGLSTVYPPVAQFAFALAHWLKPWSVDAWRAILLALDLGTCALILVLLRSLALPALWVAVYWWNPVVIKELHNSAHMDLLVVAAVAAVLVFLARAKPYAGAAAIAVGIGAKLWPVLLLPTLLRPWLSAPRVLVTATLIAAGLAAVLLAPVVLSGLDQSSGFVAYGSRWQANDALFRTFQWFVLQGTAAFGLEEAAGKVIARGLVGGALCALVLYINRTRANTATDLCFRAFITIGALFLVSPTQFPWYYAWVAVLLPVFPVRGFLVLSATLPLYYVYFYLSARDLAAYFRYGVVLVIWAPAWGLLLLDALRQRLGPNTLHRDKMSSRTTGGEPG